MHFTFFHADPCSITQDSISRHEHRSLPVLVLWFCAGSTGIRILLGVVCVAGCKCTCKCFVGGNSPSHDEVNPLHLLSPHSAPLYSSHNSTRQLTRNAQSFPFTQYAPLHKIYRSCHHVTGCWHRCLCNSKSTRLSAHQHGPNDSCNDGAVLLLIFHTAPHGDY